MTIIQKRLDQQVVVITGASSGIGLSTAERAAARGARVVLAARGEDALREIVARIEAKGGRAAYAVADVGVEGDVERVAEVALARYGRIDTWVNNAGAGAYETLVELSIAEHRRIFETNYWGTVYGSLAAIRHFRGRAGGGTLINVGSVNSDVAIPLLSAYSASKHAVKGFTDALRRELLHSGDAILVTLIKPSGIATPFPQHARNHMDREPRVVPPLYAPEIVADAILHAAGHPRREIVVGAVGPVLSGAAALAPRLMDRLLAAAVQPLSRSANPLTLSDNLDGPADGGTAHNRYAPSLPFSPYTALQTHPGRVLAGLAGLGLLLASRRIRKRTFGRFFG